MKWSKWIEKRSTSFHRLKQTSQISAVLVGLTRARSLRWIDACSLSFGVWYAPWIARGFLSGPLPCSLWSTECYRQRPEMALASSWLDPLSGLTSHLVSREWSNARQSKRIWFRKLMRFQNWSRTDNCLGGNQARPSPWSCDQHHCRVIPLEVQWPLRCNKEQGRG